MGSKLGRPVAISAVFAMLVAAVPISVWSGTLYSQLAVTESAPTMTYGDASPSFRATLTVPSDDPPLAGNTPFYISVDSVNYAGSISGTYPTYTLYVGGLPPGSPPPGQQPVVASYLSPKHGLLNSAPIVLTVLKKTPTVTCSIDNVANTYAISTPITITVTPGGSSIPVDVQNATFSITFIGPRTFTYANLRPNSAGQVATSVPSEVGVYRSQCAFSGTAFFNATEAPLTTPRIIVSANNEPGGIALYTNPTPVASGTMTTWEVIVHGRPGLPTPTGEVGLRLTSSHTSMLALGPGGSLTFQAIAPSVRPSDLIRVFYSGDPVYASFTQTFGIATPPIPGTRPPTAATAQPSSGATTSTPVASESPNEATSSIGAHSPSPRFDARAVGAAEHGGLPGGTVLDAIGSLAVLTLIGLGVGLLVRRQRQRRRA